jgi:hypothetical protein
MVARRRLPARAHALLAVFGLAVLGSAAWAQTGDLESLFRDESLQSLIDKALQLNITAKVLPPGHQPAWNSASKKVTIPGRSVAVRLVGENIRVEAVFTPYQDESGNMLLLAQGQVWFSEVRGEKTRYLTTFQSIPVAWGEKVLFFPLGISHELGDQKTFTIRLEVEILPYKELLRAPVE